MTKTYKITVNGKIYLVEVEEVTAAETAAAPVSMPESKAMREPADDKNEKVEAPIQGTILAVKVAPGEAVRKGQVLAILEAMKLENEIVSPVEGTIATVQVKDGQMVDSGTLLLTIRTK